MSYHLKKCVWFVWNYFVNFGTTFRVEVYEYFNMFMSCVSVITWIPILITLLISVMECVTCWFQCSTNSEIDTIPWMTPGMNKLHWWTASDYITIKVSHRHMKDAVLICFSSNLDQCVNFTVFWIVPLEPFLVQQALKLTTWQLKSTTCTAQCGDVWWQSRAKLLWSSLPMPLLFITGI